MRKYLAAVLLLCVVGCTMPRERTKDLSLGMTRPQVIAVLGEPDTAAAKGGHAYLVWSFWREFWARRPGDYSDRYYVRFDPGDRVDAFGWYNELE
jgi:hypothetical protein